jgi:hypothetical protein
MPALSSPSVTSLAAKQGCATAAKENLRVVIILSMFGHATVTVEI